MRNRLPLIVGALALVLAACNPSAGSDSTTAAEAPVPEAVLLSYSLEPGSSYTYEVDLDQDLNMTTTGDPSALGDEEIPGEIVVNLSGSTTFTHTVADGAEPGTYEVRIVGEFSDIEVTGTLDGEPIDSTEIPDFTAIDPIDITVVVDEQGNVISGGDPEIDEFLGAGGMGDLDSLSPALQLGRFVGPPLSTDEVAVGDSWSETIETPSFDEGTEPHKTQVDSTVTAAESLDGVDVLVIDTTIATEAIEFDLAEMLIGMFEAFIPEDATEEERAELEALTEQLKFLFSVAPSESTLTTWFDPAEGLARQAQFSGENLLEMDINMPNEETGEMIQFGMVMNMSQTVDYRLTDSTSA